MSKADPTAAERSRRYRNRRGPASMGAGAELEVGAGADLAIAVGALAAAVMALAEAVAGRSATRDGRSATRDGSVHDRSAETVTDRSATRSATEGARTRAGGDTLPTPTGSVGRVDLDRDVALRATASRPADATATVYCQDYRGHASQHRRAYKAGPFLCDICGPDPAPRPTFAEQMARHGGPVLGGSTHDG